MSEPLKALSCRQPWAYTLIHLDKDVENRPRPGKHRGITLLHASAGMTAAEYQDVLEFMREHDLRPFLLPSRHALDRGGIIGAIEILDCVEESPSPWFFGPYAFTIGRRWPLPFMPCRGTIFPLFWVPDQDIQDRARRAIGIPH